MGSKNIAPSPLHQLFMLHLMPLHYIILMHVASSLVPRPPQCHSCGGLHHRYVPERSGDVIYRSGDVVGSGLGIYSVQSKNNIQRKTKNGRAYCMIVGSEAPSSKPSPLLHFTLDPLRHKLDGSNQGIEYECQTT